MSLQVTLYTSKGCAPCNLLKPILSKVRAEHGFDLTFVEASQNTHELFVQKGIRSVPVLIVLNGEREVARNTGGISEPNLIEFLKNAGVF